MWLLLPLATLAFVVGVTLAWALGADAATPVVPIAWLAACAGAVALLRRPVALGASLVAAAFATGLWAGAATESSDPDIPAGERELLVRVESLRPASPEGRLTVRLLGHRPGPDGPWTSDGRRFVLPHAARERIPLAGDVLYLRGVPRGLGAPLHPYAFDPRAWGRSLDLAGRIAPRTDVAFVEDGAGIANRIDRVRVRLERSLLTRASPEAAPILVAIITGSRGAMDAELRARFVANGAMHILAVSGMHLALLCVVAIAVVRRAAALCPPLVRRVPADRVAAAVVAPGMVAYVVLTGAPASAVRAGVMSVVVLGSTVLGRRASGVHALCFAVLAMLAVDASWLADIGFQLSVAATLALILAANLERRRRGKARDAVERLVASVRISTVASLATAPLLLWHFGQVPLASPLTNLIVGPPLSLVALPLGLLGGLLDAAGLPGAGVCVWVADLSVRLALGGAEVFGPVLEFPLTWGRPGAVALVGWAVVAVASPGFGLASLRAHLGVAAFAGALLAADLPPAWRCGTLRMHAIPVGQGDATLLELPDGTTMLVDAGGDPFARQSTGVTAVLPYLRGIGIGRVDVVVVTHSDFDHAGGVPDLVAAARPREVWLPAERDREVLDRIRDASARVGATVRVVRWPLARVDGDLRLVAFADPSFASANDASIVVRVCQARTCFLLAGDIEVDRERALVASGIPLGAQVLKVPHHGSPTSSTPEFIDAVGPRLAIFELGDGNRFGFPNADVVRRYRDRAIRVRRTDRGPVVVEADGRTVRVRQ